MTNNPVKPIPAGKSGSGAMLLKLAGIFAVSFGIFFVLFFAYDLLSGFREKSLAAAQTSSDVQPIVVDPKIASELASVLAADTNPYPQDIKDPFSDRGGLSGKAGTAASAGTGNLVQVPAATTGGSVPRVAMVPGGAVSNVMLPPATAAVQSTKQRYDNWLSRLSAAGDAPLDPHIFAVEDLLPVGLVDGGTGQQEVLFFSQAAGRTVSFPVGTMFFDGWLTELRPEGVIFSSNDDRRVVRMRAWARSVKNLG